MSFRNATASDAPAVAALINAAFGGGDGVGWTSEAALFKGDRTDAAEIARMLADPTLVFLLFERVDGLAGCAYVKRIGGGEAYLGLLAVRPALQGSGIGSRIMTEAERIAREDWRCSRMALTTMTHRPEIVLYYERRGYARTGRIEPPVRANAATKAKMPGIMRQWMAKPLVPA